MLQKQFEIIMEKMKDSKDMIMKGHENRFEMIEEAFKNVRAKYPDSKRSQKKRRMQREIIQEEEGEDEEDSQEEEESEFE
jgi:hypothetical protein